MPNKEQEMRTFWSERAQLYGSDPRANTNDIWLRELEIAYIQRVLKSFPADRILDFGCANGFSTQRIADASSRGRFIGIDINEDMILAARAGSNEPSSASPVEFRRLDVLNDPIDERFDFIYAIRVFQNMDCLDTQKRVFERLCELLVPGGRLACIETYADGYAELNRDRVQLGLSPLPDHPHLTLLSDEFDEYASARLEFIDRQYVSSSYYLITRLAYSYMAKVNSEAIDYNHPLHQVAAMVPQVGNYGPQRALLFVKE